LNKWDDEEPEAPTKEATLPTSSSQTKQVWKEKVTTSPPQEEQSFESSSLRPDDDLDK
jgi:hypothetical protein